MKNYIKAFTLMELLIPIIVIGALTAITLSHFIGSQKKAKVDQVKSNMHTAQLAPELTSKDESTIENKAPVVEDKVKAHGPGSHGPESRGLENHGVGSHRPESRGLENHGVGSHEPGSHGVGSHGVGSHGPTAHGASHPPVMVHPAK